MAETHMISADFALLYWKGEEEKERKFCKDFTRSTCALGMLNSTK